MTYEEAIESLLNTCQDFKEAIEQLQEENTFLVETIEKNNLGQIKSERRSLLAQNEQYKRDSDIIVKKANDIKLKYESKIADVNKRLIDVKRKQSDIDSYIEVMSEEKIKNIRSEYKKLKKKNNKYLFIITLSIIFSIAGMLSILLRRLFLKKN